MKDVMKNKTLIACGWFAIDLKHKKTSPYLGIRQCTDICEIQPPDNRQNKQTNIKVYRGGAI